MHAQAPDGNSVSWSSRCGDRRGKTRVASSDYPIGWAAPNIEPTKFDPEAARQLLDDAGWKVGADGMRQKDGQKLHLTIASTSGNTLRENVEQLIPPGWKSIGVDLEIKNAAAAVLVGEWADNGLVQRGNFDIAYYGFTPGIDPSGTLSPAFHSTQIPYEGNAGEGDNASRYRNPQVDRGSTRLTAPSIKVNVRSCMAVSCTRAPWFGPS